MSEPSEIANFMGAATATVTKMNLISDENQTEELVAAFLRHRSSFHRIAFGYLANAADAEDAVQDALLSAYKHRNQFRGQAQLQTWITAIVVNSARMQLRRRHRFLHLSLNQEAGESGALLPNLLIDTGPNPEQECRASDLADRTAQLVGRLSPPLRQAFQLRVCEGLEIREIASALGTPVGTIKARLSRARANLRHLARKKMGRRMATRARVKSLFAAVQRT